MGYNTVAFMLNDMMDRLEKNPHSTLFRLLHPPMSEFHPIEQQVASVAREHGERYVGDQALQVLPTFHADETKFFRAGQNCIYDCKVLKYGTDRKTGKKTVTLELPDWA